VAYCDELTVRVKDIAVWLQPTDTKAQWEKALATSCLMWLKPVFLDVIKTVG
jgi:hypothetical protein